MDDGKVKIGVELKDEGIQSQAQQVGTKAGKGVESGIREGTEKSGGLLDKLKGKFSVAFAAIGGIVAGFSMAQMAQQIVNTGRQFEESMSKVAALSGATGDELGALEAKAREMGATTTFSASEAADALGYMALAGWDASESMEGLPGVLSLAQAGQMDLAAASDLVTDYLSAFGMEADETTRMVDVLAYAQANANTTVEGLGMAFKNVAANAHAAGMDVETTSAAISMLANQGLKGSEAGTALAAILRDMTAKAEDGAIAIGDQTVAIADSHGNYRDFAEIIRDVEAATQGMGDQEKAAALMTTFTADSIKGLNLMLNAGSGELASFRDELYGSSGAAEQMADTMTDNLEGDIKALNSALEELQLKVYDSLKEPLRDATQFATGVVVPAITTLVQNFDKIAPILATVGVALVAYRKNWDIVTASQKLAAKAMALTSSTMTTYKKAVVAGETVTYKLDKATGQYVRTNATMRTTIATSAAGMRAQAAAQNVANAAMEVGGKVAGVLGKALRTMAPVAILSAVIGIADAFRQGAERADQLEKATTGLTEATSGYGDAVESTAEESGTYLAQLDETVAKNRDVIASQAELADSIRGAFDEYGTNTALVDQYTDTIERLTSKFDEHGNKIELTAREQAELQAAVAGLNETTGETYEITNLVNGELDTSTDVILKNAKAWEKNAKAQILQEKIKDVLTQRMDAERQLKQTEEDLANAQEKVIFGIGDMAIVTEDNRFAISELTDQQDSLNQTLSASDEAYEGLMAEYEELTGSTEAASDATEGAAQANAENAEAMDGAAESAASLREANEDIIEEIGEAAKKSSLFAEAMRESGYTTEELAIKLEDMGISASDLASSIEETAAKTTDAFNRIEEVSDVSLDAMLETLAYNTEATQSWSENITALYAKAGSDSEREFVNYIAHMGVEYAPIVDQLLNDSTGKLTALAGQWSEGMSVGKEAAIAQAGLTADGVSAEMQTAVDAAAAQGGQIDANLADSVAANQGMVTDAMSGVGSAGNEALSSGFNVNAQLIPNSLTSTITSGAATATGVARTQMGNVGTSGMQAWNSSIVQNAPLLKTSMQTTAKQGAAAAASLNTSGGPYAAAGQGAMVAVGQGMLAKGSVVTAQATAVSSGAAKAFGSQTGEAHSSGVNLAQGFINGMGSMLSAVISKARELARAAIDAIKREGQQGSPWRTTTEVGRFAGQGLAVGMEAEHVAVERSARGLARSAIESINGEGGGGIAWETTKRSGRAAARGLIVGFHDIDPMAQIEASIERGVSAMVVAAQAGTMGGTTNNQTVNFNQPVQSPDQVARAMRMQQRYGLAGRR